MHPFVLPFPDNHRQYPIGGRRFCSLKPRQTPSAPTPRTGHPSPRCHGQELPCLVLATTIRLDLLWAFQPRVFSRCFRKWPRISISSFNSLMVVFTLATMRGMASGFLMFTPASTSARYSSQDAISLSGQLLEHRPCRIASQRPCCGRDRPAFR